MLDHDIVRMIMWSASKNRLKTKEWWINRDLLQEDDCELCRSGKEDRDHIVSSVFLFPGCMCHCSISCETSKRPSSMLCLAEMDAAGDEGRKWNGEKEKVSFCRFGL